MFLKIFLSATVLVALSLGVNASALTGNQESPIKLKCKRLLCDELRQLIPACQSRQGSCETVSKYYLQVDQDLVDSNIIDVLTRKSVYVRLESFQSYFIAEGVLCE